MKNKKNNNENNAKQIVKEQKTKTDNENKKRINSVNLILISVMIAIILIIAIDLLTGILLFVRSDDTSSSLTTTMENSLLSNGLSIIGIAIAVWSGLNIVTILEKNRIEEIGKQVEKYENERKKLYRMQFLEELRMDDRAIGIRFYKAFVSIVYDADDITSYIYYHLLQMERIYHEVYAKQANTVRNFSGLEINDQFYNISELLSEIEFADLSDKSKLLIEEYIYSRKAEYAFNKAYEKEVDKQKAITLFKEASNDYIEWYGIDIEQDGETIKKSLLRRVEKLQIDDESIKYVIHILNTIAEAYSKIAHLQLEHNKKAAEEKKYSSEEIAQNLDTAIKIFAMLINNHQSTNLLQEFIYRNYGCALERRWRLLSNKTIGDMNYVDFHKIKEAYDVSISKGFQSNGNMGIRENTYVTWGSFYYKTVAFSNIPALLPYYRGQIESLSLIDIDEFEKWTDCACVYMKIASITYEKNISFLKLYGIALINKAILLIRNDNLSEAESIFKMADDVLKNTELMWENLYKENSPDGYLKLLRKNCNETRAFLVMYKKNV